MNLYFIDTNVLAYAYSQTEKAKRTAATQLLSNPSACMSTQVVNEFIWIMNAKYHIGMELLTDVVKNLFMLYRIDVVDDRTITMAMDLSMRYHLPYWDSLILSSAMKMNCPILYSEDFQHGQIIEKKITITNPFQSLSF